MLLLPFWRTRERTSGTGGVRGYAAFCSARFYLLPAACGASLRQAYFLLQQARGSGLCAGRLGRKEDRTTRTPYTAQARHDQVRHLPPTSLWLGDMKT